MKKIFGCVVLMLAITVLLTSCVLDDEEMKEMKAKFAPYEASNSNVAAILDCEQIYFSDHELYMKKIVEPDETYQRGTVFLDGKIYFAATRKIEENNYSFIIYECDLYGNNKKIIFEKDGYATPPDADGSKGVMYLLYNNDGNWMNQSSRMLDSYNIRTGTYEHVSSGEDASLWRTCETFVEINNGIVTITDSQNKVHNINVEDLSDTDFSKVLIDIEYEYRGTYITENREMYFLYMTHVPFPPTPFFICRYDFETREIQLEYLFFAYDVEVFGLRSIRETENISRIP